MTRPMKDELGDILNAIREVEASLDRRSQRVQGALMVMWGAIVFLISAFYQLVTWNPAPYVAAFGPLLGWAWAAPVAVGYAVGVVVGVRASRVLRDPAPRRDVWLNALPALVSSAIAAGFVLLGRPQYIAGALLLGYAATVALGSRGGRGPMRTLSLVASGVCAVGGLALVLRPVSWQWIVAGVLMGGTLLALGRLRMAATDA
jgi:hypothetical protein